MRHFYLHHAKTGLTIFVVFFWHDIDFTNLVRIGRRFGVGNVLVIHLTDIQAILKPTQETFDPQTHHDLTYLD